MERGSRTAASLRNTSAPPLSWLWIHCTRRGKATGGRETLTMDGVSAYRRAGVAGKRAVSYRVVEPRADHAGSIGCIQMDHVGWERQWMVARPDRHNR